MSGLVWQQLEIIDDIVAGIPVTVVNYFLGVQVSTEVTFHDDSVLKHHAGRGSTRVVGHVNKGIAISSAVNPGVVLWIAGAAPPTCGEASAATHWNSYLYA